MRWSLWLSLLLLGVAIGCNKSTDKSGEQENPPASKPADGQTSATQGEPPATTAEEPSTQPPTQAEQQQASPNQQDTVQQDTAQQDTAQQGSGEQGTGEQLTQTDDATGAETTEEPETPSKLEYIRRVRQAFLARQMDTAIAILEEALQKYPNDMDVIASLISVRLRHGMDLQEQDAEKAVEMYRQAAALAHQAFDDQSVPDEMKGLYQAILYAEAQVAAYEGNVDQAVEALKKAVEAGWQDVSALEEDPRLVEAKESLRQAIREHMIAEVRQEFAEFTSFPFDFQLANLDGETVSLNDFKGKVVIVDFWGTWCPPCRMEIPHFVKLQEKYADDLQVVGVNYEGENSDEATEKIRGFAKENGVNYPLVIGDEATQARVPDFEGYPTTLFIDREGNVRLKVVGYHPYEMLELYVEELVKEGKTDPET